MERSFVQDTITRKQILKSNSIYYFNPIRNLSSSPTHSQEKGCEELSNFEFLLLEKERGGEDS